MGGTGDAFALASPLLAHMGRKIIHCGPAGSGLVAKICNNLMLGVEQIVTAEAMLLGQRMGVRPDVLAEVINSSTGACWSSSVNNPVPAALPGASPPSERDFDGGFATALMIKVRCGLRRFYSYPILSIFLSGTDEHLMTDPWQ